MVELSDGSCNAHLKWLDQRNDIGSYEDKVLTNDLYHEVCILFVRCVGMMTKGHCMKPPKQKLMFVKF